MSLLNEVRETGIVPVVVIKDAKDAVPTAKALLKGGINFMEITFRTDAAAESIRLVADQVPEMHVGAGTVITIDQCKEAERAGAAFMVSPGFNREVVDYCIEKGIDIFPGVATPTEIMMGIECGLKVLKFFPAKIYGGISALKAIGGPFTDVSFIPTGGVGAGNLSEFAGLKNVFAVGGSWICTAKDIEEGNFEAIAELSKEAVTIWKESVNK